MALNNLKQTPIPVVPRTLQIVNADGTPTRSGQLLLQQLSANVLGYGAAGGTDTSMPDGSLYVVQGNNSEVLYQLQGGEWHYVAGTMWGTLNPDQRPTGLGPDDAGFTFRSIDSDPNYAPREFIWSGQQWVETTLVEYGLHPNRPPADSLTPPRTIYVETDRSGVIYQQQANAWHFLAGAMWGTLSPDQRPTDLGANDAGFTFRTSVAPPRSFVWSGSAWIETTPLLDPTTTTGDMLYRSSTSVTRLPIGTAGQMLTVSGGLPAWSAGLWQAGTGGVIYYTGGLVGIGTAAPASTLDVAGNIKATGGYFRVNADAGYEWFNGSNYTDSSGSWQVIHRRISDGAWNYGLTVTPGGFLGLGTSPSYQLHLSVDSAAKPSTNVWTIVSDIRTKRNINRFAGDMEVIRRLDPIVAEYNGKGGTPEGTRVVSLDPASLREIVPEAVSSIRAKLDPADIEDSDILGVNTHELFYHMLRAIQHLDREIRDLKAQHPEWTSPAP